MINHGQVEREPARAGGIECVGRGDGTHSECVDGCSVKGAGESLDGEGLSVYRKWAKGV